MKVLAVMQVAVCREITRAVVEELKLKSTPAPVAVSPVAVHPRQPILLRLYKQHFGVGAVLPLKALRSSVDRVERLRASHRDYDEYVTMRRSLKPFSFVLR